uniref:Uncharacterized protein n=1 Tax=Erpetoichthys calabaricus TaxID=27687 RepID=A0A8C4RJW4_ERPCA
MSLPPCPLLFIRHPGLPFHFQGGHLLGLHGKVRNIIEEFVLIPSYVFAFEQSYAHGQSGDVRLHLGRRDLENCQEETHRKKVSIVY